MLLYPASVFVVRQDDNQETGVSRLVWYLIVYRASAVGS
jgi:hypothetical protein